MEKQDNDINSKVQIVLDEVEASPASLFTKEDVSRLIHRVAGCATGWTPERLKTVKEAAFSVLQTANTTIAEELGTVDPSEVTVELGMDDNMVVVESIEINELSNRLDDATTALSDLKEILHQLFDELGV